MPAMHYSLMYSVKSINLQHILNIQLTIPYRKAIFLLYVVVKMLERFLVKAVFASAVSLISPSPNPQFIFYFF